MFGNSASLSGHQEDKYGRPARNIGLPRNSPWKAISDRLLSWKRAELLPPSVVHTGPCKENKLFGDEIDLEKLPAPYLHVGDGGKYL